MQIDFYNLGEIDESLLYYAVIVTRYRGGWLFVQQKAKDTWEMPAGRREPGEAILDTARRELYEETGALTYTIQEICDYSVTQTDTGYGRLFYAEITDKGPLPDSEIGALCLENSLPRRLTYPEIQPYLLQKVLTEIGGSLSHRQSVVAVTSDSFPDWVVLGLELWPEHSKEELSQIFWHLLHSDTEQAFLYQVGGEYVGFINVSLRTDSVEGSNSSPVGYVEGIYVRPHYRNMAIAKGLLEKGEKWALGRGCTQMGSDVELGNTGGHGFHRQVGFREVNRIVCYVKDIRA